MSGSGTLVHVSAFAILGLACSAGLDRSGVAGAGRLLSAKEEGIPQCLLGSPHLPDPFRSQLEKPWPTRGSRSRAFQAKTVTRFLLAAAAAAQKCRNAHSSPYSLQQMPEVGCGCPETAALEPHP